MGSDIQQCLAANDLVAFRWLGLVNEADASGRRLSEGAAPAQIQSTREMEYVACPYGDTRSSAKKPMNRSALVSMTSCWDRLCDWSRAVAVAYGKREGVVRTTFLDVWRVAAALRTAPFFLLLRPATAENRQSEGIPEWVAGAYKAARGVEDAILHMACTGMDVGRPYCFTSLYDFACKHRLFEGSVEVCAGSPSLIKVFIEQLALAPGQSSAPRANLMGHPITSERAMGQLLDYAACETLVESLSAMYEVGRFRSMDVRRGLGARERRSAHSGKELDQGRYPLSALARALSRDYGAANERLLRGYLQLAFPNNAAVCMSVLAEPLLTDPALGHAPNDANIDRYADAYLGKVSGELFRAEQRIRTILGIEPLGATLSPDCLVSVFGPSH
jgi:hypothetical protein